MIRGRRGLALSALLVAALLPVTGLRADRATQRLAAADGASLEVLCNAIVAANTALDGATPAVTSRWPASSPRGSELARRLSPCAEQNGSAARTLTLEVHRNDLVVTLEKDVQRNWLERFLRIGEARARRTLRIRLDAQLRQYVAQIPQLNASNVVARSMRMPPGSIIGLSSAERLGIHGLLVARHDRISALGMRVARGRPRLAVLHELDRPFARTHRRVVAQFSPGPGGYYFRRNEEPLSLLTFDGQLQLAPSPSDECDDGTFPLRDACVRFARGRDYFDSRLATRVGHAAPPRAPTSFYARHREQVRRTDGTRADCEVVVSPRGRVVSRTGDRTVGAAGYGAAMAAMDIDQDGQLEVLISSSEPAQGDTLRLLRVRSDGSLHRVWSSEPMSGSILHAAVADLDGDGRPEFVAAEQQGNAATLWMVR